MTLGLYTGGGESPTAQVPRKRTHDDYSLEVEIPWVGKGKIGYQSTTRTPVQPPAPATKEAPGLLLLVAVVAALYLMSR